MAYHGCRAGVTTAGREADEVTNYVFWLNREQLHIPKTAYEKTVYPAV